MPFDVDTGRSNGAAIVVIDNARTNLLNGAVPFAVSSAGTLVYLPGESTSAASMLSATRSGQTEVLFERRLIGTFRLAPGGQRVAVSINDGQEDIWLLDLKQRALSRFTFGTGAETFPVWSPDGQRLFYATNSEGIVGILAKEIGGQEARVGLRGPALFPTTISPDGSLLVGRGIPTASYDVVALPIGGGELLTLFASAGNESDADFSPDGRFIAFQSDETSRSEIFVQAYPSGGRWQMTTGGGDQPRWTSGGRELIYRDGQTIMAVPVTLQPFSAGPPRRLFSVPNLYAYDVTADGQRFIVATNAENRGTVNFALITGWIEELKARMGPPR